MPTATSNVEIVNLAFDLLRQNEKATDINSPSNKSEALAARWYDVTRRSVLCAFPWNFARKRVLLPLNPISPAFGFRNAYILPVDFVGLVFIGENYDEDYEVDYAIEGNQILINNDGGASLKICYLWDIVSVTRFDPLFVDLLAYELACRFAKGIVGLTVNMKDIYETKKGLEAKARMKNGRDNPPKIRNVSPLLARRRLGTQGGSAFDGTHLLTQ